MISIQEALGALLMSEGIGTTAAAQNHLVTTMGKVPNGVTLRTTMPAGNTVFDHHVELYHPFEYY